MKKVKVLRKERYSLTTVNFIPKEVTDKINELVDGVNKLSDENQSLRREIDNVRINGNPYLMD